MSYQTPPLRFFHSEVEKHFSFLSEEFGLKRVHDHSIELRAMFQNEELDLWIGNDKGSYDAIFWLKKTVPWLRPFESRMFLVIDIVKRVAPEEFENLRSAVQQQSLTPEQECQTVLQFYARALKQYCLPVLQGQYQILEQLYTQRTTLAQ